MAVISIIGTGGVGKSFLVKQLAAATGCPAFFEGEEGTIPKEVFENVMNGEDPAPRYRFFMERFRKNLSRAIAISGQGMDCFVDGSIMSPRAIMSGEDEKYHEELMGIIDTISHLKSDITILLFADEKRLRENIVSRSRALEHEERAIKRMMGIQEEYLRFAREQENTIVIDRTELYFTDPAHLKIVLDKIDEMKKDIPGKI